MCWVQLLQTIYKYLLKLYVYIYIHIPWSYSIFLIIYSANVSSLRKIIALPMLTPVSVTLGVSVYVIYIQIYCGESGSPSFRIECIYTLFGIFCTKGLYSLPFIYSIICLLSVWVHRYLILWVITQWCFVYLAVFWWNRIALASCVY